MKTISSLALLFAVACGPAPAPEVKAPDDATGTDSAATGDNEDGETGAGGAAAAKDPAAGDDKPASPGAACIEKAGRRIKPNVLSTRVTVSHILVKHAKAEGSSASITRTREEACLRAEEALAKMVAGADFAELVAEYSDEEGAAAKKGLVGDIWKDDTKPDFASAAFVLRRNQVSPVVETTEGFHIIMRTK